MPIPFLNSINLTKNQVENFCIYNVANDPTGSLTVAGDYGYFWLNTTNSGGTIPTLKWWDGTNVRSLVDSTNIGSFTSGLATDLAGGGAGQIVYQDGANDTKFLAAGTAGQVLSSNAASAPSWVNQSSLAAGTAANISGGLAGQLLYQSALATTAKLTIGSAGQALVVNSGASAPEWVDQSTLSVGSATNKPGGSVGDILVQSGSGSTGFLNVGTNGQVITSNGLSPQYVNQSTLSVGSATTSGTATNIAGGAANRIPYQTDAGTTGFITDAANAILTTNASSVPALTAAISVTVGKAVDIALGAAGDLLYQSASNDTSFLNIGANGSILTSTGTAPQWSASIPSGSVSGLAASATTDTTDAGNISSGTLGLARLSLATDQFYVGDASNNPAATAKSSIRLSGFGTPNADVAMGGYKLTGLGAPTASTDAATMGYVDSVAQGLDVKASCLVATTADITLASPGAVTIDGIYSATDFTAGTTRILVKDQSAPAENGIYIWQGPSSAMTRSADADTWDELVGAFTFIERGTANADSGWVCTVNAGGTLGTTAVTWVKFSQAGSYTAGNGIVQSGTSFNFAQSTNYTADTIPYASGANTIGFIGAGTADQVLRVPGAGGTPAFGAIDLSKSAAVTGTLAVGNGGTGITSFGAGIATFLGTPTSANLATAVTDETGTGALVFADSPTLAGTPLSTTATADTNTTQIATTAYVIGQASATTPAALGTAAVGTSLKYARADHVHALPTIDLSNGVTGTLPVANGGTGATTFTAGQVLYGNGTSALSSSANLHWDNGNNRLGVNGRISYNGVIGEGADATLSSSGTVLLHGNSSTWTEQRSYTGGTERLRIASDGVCTWSNVGGVAGTAMTLNGTGLGIGVSPATKLHIAGTGNQELKIQTNTSGNPILTLAAAGQDGASILYNRTDNYLSVNISAITGALRLSTAGNLGLGVTPSAWGASLKALQVGAVSYGSLFDFGNGVTSLSSNLFFSGSSYGRMSTSSRWSMAYWQDITNGAHSWVTSTAAGTNASTPTMNPLMTLDASGRLSVGPEDFSYMTGSMLVARKNQSAITYIGVDNQQNNSSAGAGIDLEAYGGSWYIYNAHSSNFTNPLIFKMGSNERIRFTANGEALFKTNGTASTPTIAHADNPDTGLYWPTNSDTLALAVGGSDAVYIDANRRVGIGTPTPNAGLVISSSGAQGFEFSPNAAGVAQLETYNRSTAAYFSLRINSDDLRICTGSSATERLRIKSTGQLNFTGLAADPTGAAGDVYYNSTAKALKLYATDWKTLPRKAVVQGGAGTGTTIAVAHNLNTNNVSVTVLRTTDNVVVFTDVAITDADTVTITFASSVTKADYTITVIG